ncbi:MAG: 16S rRNA (guanine(966)-N(2))-methyltransferase RsmD [Clostridia bacterium]|nr:16S rRNA (guanine(966)-N(2))-methyltransferase RsmD [Clostridia bacterium]
MRIITGSARGTKLYTLEGDATRPTSERAKEAVFSTLQFCIEGRRVLDLFSGSGQLALEALSRGAAYAVMVDHSKPAAEIIRKNAEKTHLSDKCRIEVGDVKDRLYRMRDTEAFDIVFIDPPYALGLVPATLSALLKYGRVKSTTYIVCETASENDVFCGDAVLSAQFEVFRRSNYGIACVTVLRPLIDSKKEN